MLSDLDIRALIGRGELVIDPLDPGLIGPNGVDLRLGRGHCRIADDTWVVDVNAATAGDISLLYRCGESDELVLAPGSRYLLHTLERVRIPSGLAGLVELRSTFARLGFGMPPTVIDAGFEGQLTIEVETPPFPVKVRAGTPFLHIVFFELRNPANPYRGRYQGQSGVALPRLPVRR